MAKTYLALKPFVHSRPAADGGDIGEPRLVERDERVSFDDEAYAHVRELLQLGVIREETIAEMLAREAEDAERVREEMERGQIPRLPLYRKRPKSDG